MKNRDLKALSKKGFKGYFPKQKFINDTYHHSDLIFCDHSSSSAWWGIIV